MTAKPLFSFAAVFALVMSAEEPTAHADWPMARQNPTRSAIAAGKAQIQNPQPFWRYFLGGRISSVQALTADIDGDGAPEIIHCVAGSVSARKAATDQEVWTNTETECTELKGLFDLDADGTNELVLRSLGQMAVVRLADGKLLWQEPRGEMGTIGAMGIDDIDGAPGLELVVQECGCCSINSGNSGYAYGFRGQGASLQNPRKLWEMPPVTCGANRATAIVRTRDTSRAEIVFADRAKISLLDGKTGAVVVSSPTLGDNLNASRCRGVPSSDSSREDVLCVVNSPGNATERGRRLFLLRSSGTSLQPVWDIDIGEQDARVVTPPGFVGDFDRDGELEILVSGEDELSQPVTYVLAAKDGSSEATLPGEKALGALAINASGAHRILTEQDATLSVWTLNPSGSNRLQRQWARKNRQPVSYVDPELNRKTILRSRIVSYSSSGTSNAKLVLQDPKDQNFFEVIQLGSTSPSLVASYKAPSDDMVTQVWPVPSTGSVADRLLIAQSSGNLHLLSETLEPVSGNANFGVRFAGFYSPAEFRKLRDTPVVAEIEAGKPGLLVTNSRGQLLRLNTQEASFSSPPTSAWAAPKHNGTMIVRQLLGADSGIVAIDYSEDNSAIVAMDANGLERWRNSLTGVVLADLVWGLLNDDSVPDVVVQYGLTSDLITRTRAIDGRDGTILWEALPYDSTNRQPSGGSMADWNGDGIDDFVFHQVATRVLDGRTGNEILASPDGPSYAMPILYDVNDNGDLEVTRIASDQGPATLSHDLATTLWQGDTALRAFNYGTIIACQGKAPQLAHSSLENPTQLYFVETSGPNAGNSESRSLANGQLFQSQQAADEAQAVGGQLNSPVVHEDLAGDGRAVVLVGSRDGWLYGIDACNKQLLFAFDFNEPVGSVVFGDSDGDGLDEILVSVADGYLYALKNAIIDAPGTVLDIDPTTGRVDEDIDRIDSQDKLYGSWSAVAGATGYEVAIVRAEKDGGGIISPGGWRDVGNVTTASVASLALVRGQLYYFAVRARVGTDRSPERLSDGVVIGEIAPPTQADDPLLVGRSWLYCATDLRPIRNGRFGLLMSLIAMLMWRRRCFSKLKPRQ